MGITIRIKSISTALAVSLCFISATLTQAASNNITQGTDKTARPNVVLVFADDAGYADFGFHGSKVMKTPNIDKIAEQGIIFTQAYVTDPTCGPSRAGLLTGKYQQRFGYIENNVPGYMSDSSLVTGADMGLPLDQVTMGDYMQSLGYKTGFFGKWHLGGTDEMHPINRGFDTFYGFRGGDRSYYAYGPDAAARKQQATFFDKKMESGLGDFKEPEKYVTDLLGDKVSNFIQTNKDEPFFAFLSFSAVHTPIEAKPTDLAVFPNLSGTRQQVAAMTLAMDRATGVVMQKLEELGLAENTIVVFTNDNGGPTDKNASSNFPFSGTKSNHLEGGVRVPFVMRWPSKIDAGQKYDEMISTMDLLPTFYEAAGGNTYKKPIDGVNLLPFIMGNNESQPHEALYWKKDARAAIRYGNYKLLRFPDRPAELYDVSADKAEANDLSVQKPDVVRMLFKKIFEWELQHERPLWMLKQKFEKGDIDRMDKYRIPHNPDVTE